MSSRKDLALGIFIVVAGVVILLGKAGCVWIFRQNIMAAGSAAAGYFSAYHVFWSPCLCRHPHTGRYSNGLRDPVLHMQYWRMGTDGFIMACVDSWRCRWPV